LKEGVTELEKMIAFNYSEPATLVEEVFAISDYQSPVLFEVTSTYTSADADSVRLTIARKQLAELAKEFLDYYFDQFPGIEQAALPAISDDRENNILIVREKY